MNQLIEVFAGIGLACCILLAIPTLFVWGVWAWYAVAKAGPEFTAALVSLRYFAVPRFGDALLMKHAAARVLFSRWCHLRDVEPEIAAEFWRLIRDRISNEPYMWVNGPPPRGERRLCRFDEGEEIILTRFDDDKMVDGQGKPIPSQGWYADADQVQAWWTGPMPRQYATEEAAT